ncbi:MAG: pilus assembly PilX N-terminal domain-containing protein [Gammaproteobacteria bacterium]|nr:pilus assembly PilX N-terminal domain-containing protein [Gammaproteobacteria bacterium]
MNRPPPKQRGIALIVALILLAGATLIGIAAVNTSVMELKMAGNAEAMGDSFQTALAAIDFVMSDTSNLPTVGALGIKRAANLVDPVFTANTNETITAWATRLDDCGLPPRARSASSVVAYSAFVYEVGSSIDRHATGFGLSEMSQGYILLGPKC